MRDIVQFIDAVLPLQSHTSGIYYNESQNMFVTTAYTSHAGNTYFKGIRLSERILIVFDIGIGYYHTFLNSLSVFTNQTNEEKLVGKKSYYNHKFNEKTIKDDAKAIVKQKLITQGKTENLQLDIDWVNEFVDALVEEAYRNQIKTAKAIQMNKLLPN